MSSIAQYPFNRFKQANKMATKVIIDTDPGIDDAMAILFAWLVPSIEIVGLTTIFGNVSVEHATENALRLVEMMGADIPVAMGARRPLVQDLREYPDYVHGKNGFGDVLLGKPTSKSLDISAADFIIEQIMNHPNEISLVAIGPLTNLALALKKEPAIKQNVKEVIFMGGAVTANGNVNPAAEANMISDPHAADIVVTSDWPVTMIGLDVSHQIVMTESYLKEVHNESSFAGSFLHDISGFYLDFHRQYGVDGIYTHDPSTIAYLMDPNLFSIEEGEVRVVTEGIACGKTIMNRDQNKYGKTDWSGIPKLKVCMGVNNVGILELYRKTFINSKDNV